MRNFQNEEIKIQGITIPGMDLHRKLNDEQGERQFVDGLMNQFCVISSEQDKERDKQVEEYARRQYEENCEYNFQKCCDSEKFRKVELSELGELENVVFGKNAEKATMQLFWDYISDVAAGKSSMLWLCGCPGTGKTTIAMAVMHELCRRGISCDYFKSHKIMQKLKDSEHFSSKVMPEDIIKDVCGSKFRVIDEVGRWPVPEWEKFRMFEISNELYENYKSGIFITNMRGAEFAQFIGSATTDRFRGISRILEFRGSSYRGTEKELYTK